MAVGSGNFGSLVPGDPSPEAVEEERRRAIAAERERERRWAWERDHPELAVARADRDPRKKASRRETRRDDDR